jgi:tRNA A-37 threonylcarbamoyl transferase component Bud32
MASASRRRGSLGDRRGFFHLCGSPIRTHKLELDYVHGKAHSPTQLRPAELPADIDTPLMHRRPGKKNLKTKQRHAEADAAMAALARQLGQEGGGYYDSPRGYDRSPTRVDSDTPMSCVADEGSNNSMRLEGARQAGIPLYLSDWFDPNKESNQRRRQTNVVMTCEEPESESSAAASDCSIDSNKENQFLKSHQNVDMADVVIGQVIGEGAFGKVFKAEWKGRNVAVKVLIRQNLSADVVREFETEVKIMSFLHHPNICMLLGACLAPENRALVIELVEQGSLWAVLRTRRRQLSDEMRARFVLDTARGMSYLHHFELPILHRDMKSPNLLVEHDYSIKISDFGLSRVKAQIQTMTGNCGTVQWMAYVGVTLVWILKRRSPLCCLFVVLLQARGARQPQVHGEGGRVLVRHRRVGDLHGPVPVRRHDADPGGAGRAQPRPAPADPALLPALLRAADPVLLDARAQPAPVLLGARAHLRAVRRPPVVSSTSRAPRRSLARSRRPRKRSKPPLPGSSCRPRGRRRQAPRIII